MSDACKIANCNFTFHGFIHISEKNPDAVYTGADPGFLEGGFKFTKGVRLVKPRLHIHDFLYDSPRFTPISHGQKNRDGSW